MFKFTQLFDIDEEQEQVVEVEQKKDYRKQLPWVDKYRPKTIDGIVQQYDVIKVLKDTLKTGNLPHLLFYGPSGTGKTSTVLAIVNELFGPIKVRDRVIELNASDERGINIVRYKIISFAKNAIGSRDPNYLCPPYKIIILDEADAMTTEAQSALRKVMENMSNIARFCFICNYINQIIEPIASRCMKFRFKPIDDKSMTEKLKYIATNENLIVEDNVIEAVSKIAKGDVRKGIMTLQNLKYVNSFKKSITVQDVYDTTNSMPVEEADNIWRMCIDIENASLDEVIEETNKLKSFGYPINNILEQLRYIMTDSNISDVNKSLISIQLSITERRLLEGADEYIQLQNVLCYIKGVVGGVIDYYPSYVC
jgi:replication factor C subunit 2/4